MSATMEVAGVDRDVAGVKRLLAPVLRQLAFDGVEVAHVGHADVERLNDGSCQVRYLVDEAALRFQTAHQTALEINLFQWLSPNITPARTAAFRLLRLSRLPRAASGPRHGRVLHLIAVPVGDGPVIAV